MDIEQFQKLRYLGDGAYVGIVDQQIAVFASNGITVTAIIYLDVTSAVMLNNYIREITEVK